MFKSKNNNITCLFQHSFCWTLDVGYCENILQFFNVMGKEAYQSCFIINCSLIFILINKLCNIHAWLKHFHLSVKFRLRWKSLKSRMINLTSRGIHPQNVTLGFQTFTKPSDAKQTLFDSIDFKLLHCLILFSCLKCTS